MQTFYSRTEKKSHSIYVLETLSRTYLWLYVDSWKRHNRLWSK